MMGLSLNELLLLVLIIAVLSGLGLWQPIIRAIRELRGDRVETPSPSRADMDVSYKMLGVSPSAEWGEVEKAYRQKAKLHHPDHGGDKDTMQALNEAYSQIKRARGR